MSHSASASEPANRANNFNLLRLIFATLVLLSHAFELKDGNRSRELLTSLFHALSFAELAVDGFFLLSGFLIVQSWQRSPQLLGFLQKRVLRIYPAFIVALLVCVFVVGPLGSEGVRYFSLINPLQFIVGLFSLSGSSTPPAFKGHPYPYLNASLWTIEYEFRCYLMVALLGLCGIVARRSLWLALSVIALVLSVAPTVMIKLSSLIPGSLYLLLDPVSFARFAAFFMAGGCFYLFRDRIRYQANTAIGAALVLLPCMFYYRTAQIALATVGAYLLFGFAFADTPRLKRFRDWPDVSYGLYLYGWPVQQLLLRYIPMISPWLLFPLSLVLSYGCGFLSWTLIERPFLRLKPKQVQVA